MTERNLYIVATPIGNLADISYRAIEILRKADLIACEDTRVTKKLLAKYNIEAKLLSYHQHSGHGKMAGIAEKLKNSKQVALVTDAGTPGISDPGNKLIEYLLKHVEDLIVVPVPGPCALIAALSISGFPTDKFVFMGFPPQKRKRKQYFQNLAHNDYTTVFYESAHRIKKALVELDEVLSVDRKICLCRELTKKFESIYRGKIKQLIRLDIPEKGEFVVVIRGKNKKMDPR